MVGSRNQAKVEAVRSVFQRVWPDCTVRGHEVEIPESISDMPIGEQIRLGARYRARAVMGPGVAFGVGAEGGVQFVDGKAYLLNWCVIADPDGRLYESPSPWVRLPEVWGEAVRQGKELGPLVAEWSGRPDINQKEGAIGILTKGLVDRQQFFEQALLCALAPLIVPELYRETP